MCRTCQPNAGVGGARSFSAGSTRPAEVFPETFRLPVLRGEALSRHMKSWRILLTLLVPFLFTNCRGTLKTKAAAKTDDGRVPTEVRAEDAAQVDAWKAAGNKGGFYPAKEALTAPITPANSGFVVDLDAQRAYLYQGSELIAYAPIASGRKYYRTETGDYTIGEKELNHHSKIGRAHV